MSDGRTIVNHPCFDFDCRDCVVLNAVWELLEKLHGERGTPKKEAAHVAELRQAFLRLPQPTHAIDVTLEVGSPKRRHGEIVTTCYWSVSMQPDLIEIGSGGAFYRPSTGHDSFTTMRWSMMPGRRSEFEDHRDVNKIVPGLKSFPDSVGDIDFTQGGYRLYVTTADTPSVDEQLRSGQELGVVVVAGKPCREDSRLRDRVRSAPFISWDDAERQLARSINWTEVDAREAFYACHADKCDFCGGKLNDRSFFIDGGVSGRPFAANMCAQCFADNGVGIGWGKGQLFLRQPDCAWRLVAGFPPEDDDLLKPGTRRIAEPMNQMPLFADAELPPVVRGHRTTAAGRTKAKKDAGLGRQVRPYLILESRRGTFVKGLNYCSRCAKPFERTWRYARSSHGIVVLCANCRDFCLDRSFGKLNSLGREISGGLCRGRG